MQKHTVLSLISLTLAALLPVLATAAAPTMAPDPEPIVEDGSGDEGVATYAPAPSSNGISLSIGHGLSLAAWSNTSLDSAVYAVGPPLVSAPDASLRVGYRMNNLVAFGTLAYDRVARTDIQGHCKEPDTGFVDNCKTWESVDTSLSLLTIGAGARYLMEPPTANLTTAYATAGLLVSMPGISNSSPAKSATKPDLTEKEYAEKVGAGALGFGFNLGGGAEYYVGEGFSIGGEAGLAFHTVSWRDGNVSQSSFSLYSSVLLNFYL